LRIGAPSDAFELEADRIAAQVLSQTSTEPAKQQHPIRVTGQVLQGLATDPSAPVMTADHAGVNDVLRETGQPLPAQVRAFFEPRFGHDFSKVRIHADDQAAKTVSALSAGAYTSGNHIVFGPQRYAPLTKAGSRILAHELAHVVQQTGPSAANPPYRAPLIQRFTNFNVAAQTTGAALGWTHPSSTGLLVSDDGKMAVEDKGWKHSKRVWALDPLITSSNSILSSQDSAVRLKSSGGTISGVPPEPGTGSALTLNEVKVESKTGGALELTGDCGQACKEVMGAPDTSEAAVAVVHPRGIERYTTPTVYESSSHSASGLSSTQSWSEDIFRMEFPKAVTREEALKLYDDLSPDKKDKFDKKYGINKYAAPSVGRGITISTETDMPGFAQHPGKDTWNFHFASAILASGSDYVSMENIAGLANTAWFFWMYGPEKKSQSFHEFQGAMKEHGTKFTTMVVQPDKLLNGKTTEEGVHLVADPGNWETTRIGKLNKGADLRVIAKGPAWHKVLVLKGTQVGKTGWVSSKFFKVN
jgi:hypothetical protein